MIPWTPNPVPDSPLKGIAEAMGKLIDSKITASQQVEYATLGPTCEGLSGLNFLNDKNCNPATGPLVLATRMNGVPRLISVASGGNGTIVLPPTLTPGVAMGPSIPPTGRVFVDSFGRVFEGRNGAYFPASGRREAGLNGAYLRTQAELGYPSLVAGGLVIPLPSAMISGYGSSGELPQCHATIIPTGGASMLIGLTQMMYTNGGTGVVGYWSEGTDPHCVYGSTYGGEPWGTGAYILCGGPTPMNYLQPLPCYTGLSDIVGGGFRISSDLVASVEGNDAAYRASAGALPGHKLSPVLTLTIRDATTFRRLCSRPLTEVTSWILSEGPSARFSLERATVPYYGGQAPWMAGVRVSPSIDGTFVVTVKDTTRAWVFEVVRGGELTALQAAPEPLFTYTPYPSLDIHLNDGAAPWIGTSRNISAYDGAVGESIILSIGATGPTLCDGYFETSPDDTVWTPSSVSFSNPSTTVVTTVIPDPGYVRAVVTRWDGIAAFVGSGLNDAVFSGGLGTAAPDFTAVFDVRIQANSPDLFRWQLNSNGWTNGVTITGLVQALGAYGVSVQFGATSGHHIGDKWTFTFNYLRGWIGRAIRTSYPWDSPTCIRLLETVDFTGETPEGFVRAHYLS